MTVILLGCAATQGRIEFDLSAFDEEGLYGPPDGKRAMSYEFCIPAEEACREEVERIDGTVEVYGMSPGRIGCGAEEYLCVGHTHQADCRMVLRELMRLDYVERIAPHWGE